MDRLYDDLLCDAEHWIATLTENEAMELYGVDLNHLETKDALALAYAKETFRFIRAVVREAKDHDENGEL